MRILMGKILPIFPRLNFTPNTLGAYGLTQPQFDQVALCLARLTSRREAELQR